MKYNIQIIVLLLLVHFQGHSQESISEVDTIVYKKIDTTSLIMKVIYPPAMDKSKKYPGMIFYFGGGFVQGSISHFERQASYFAERDIVCFLADYRVKNRQGTSIFECIMDAKSAIRYIRENADRFNIDKDKIIASGGSAGGYLAAADAIITHYDDPTDNLSISPKPNALVLFNPIIDFGPGFKNGYERFSGDKYKEMSPLHNISKGIPPTIIFLGTEDKFVPTVTAEYYKLAMEGVGSRCDLFLYEGQAHGFFNRGEFYKKTVFEADKFLISLGYLTGEPTIMK
jgi:acetyl esterase